MANVPWTHCDALTLVERDLLGAGYALESVDDGKPKLRVYSYVKSYDTVGKYTITVTVPDRGYPRVWSTRINVKKAIVTSAAKWRRQFVKIQPYSSPDSSSSDTPGIQRRIPFACKAARTGLKK